MRPALLALAVALAACGGDPEPFDAAEYDGGDDVEVALDGETDADHDLEDGLEAVLEAAQAERPATDTATISIEGMDETIALRLVRYPDVPLPFSTYLPDGWTDDVAESGEGTAVRFTTGEPPSQALVTLFVPSEPNQSGTAGLARALAESRGGASAFEPGEGPPWATAGFSFSDDAGAGSVTVGEHAGTSFYVLEAFPYEMGDGFVPRAELVQDRLRWLDDGTGL